MEHSLFNWNDKIPENSTGYDSSNSEEYKDYRVEESVVRGIPSDGNWQLTTHNEQLNDRGNKFIDARTQFCNGEDSMSVCSSPHTEKTVPLPENYVSEETESGESFDSIELINKLNNNNKLKNYLELKSEIISELPKTTDNDKVLKLIEKKISENPRLVEDLSDKDYFENFQVTNMWWVDFSVKMIIILVICILSYKLIK
jgi:hypothetical protein